MRVPVVFGLFLVVLIIGYLTLAKFYSMYKVIDLPESYICENGQDIVRFRTVSSAAGAIWKYVYPISTPIVRMDHEIGRVTISDKSHCSYGLLKMAKAIAMNRQEFLEYDEIWLDMYNGGCKFTYLKNSKKIGAIDHADKLLNERQ